MPLGNLSVNVNADIGGFTTGMEQAAQAARQGMGASSSAVDAFRASLMQGSADMRAAAAQIGGGMEAANAAIMAASKSSEEALRKLKATASDVDTTSMGEKIAYGIGAGIGAGIVTAQTAWQTFVEWTKAKAIVTGVVITAIFAAVGLGAIYTAYKVISGSIGFIAGLITGDSYKSASIDALIVANNQVKEIQNSLFLTAQQAAATNAAIAAIGANKTDYIAVFTGAATAVRANTEELDRLGIKYKDNAGKLLPLEQVVKNVNQALGKYTEGWDRNQAASAIGIGTAAQVAAAAAITGVAIAAAGARLDDYNLGIGADSQAAVKRYEDAMTAFNRETDLTAQGFKRAWADQIMPILTDFAEFFREGFPFAVNAFRYSMATITSLFYGLKTVVYMVSESIVGSISAIGLALGGVALAGARVLSGDFTGAKEALVSGWSDAKTRLAGIGDNIVAQARHNAGAMRQAWAMDDRNAPGLEKAKDGKTWTPKPTEKKAAAAAAVPLDDVAKRVMEGKLKAQDDFIADEKTLMQTREQFLKNYYADDSISAAHYYSASQGLINQNLAVVQAAYDTKIAAIQEYIRVHKGESNKEADIVAEENKITEIRHKKVNEEIATNRDLALSYMALANERTAIANSLLKADAIENKSYQHRLSVITAFRDAQLGNAIEGNSLLESENARHLEAMSARQSGYDLQALSSMASTGDQMYALLKNAGQEQTLLAKSMFLANKAVAVAQIIINTEAAASKAQLEGGTFAGFALSAIIRASGYASAGIVAGTAIAGAREKGGPVWSGGSFLVGEKGREIFTPSAGGTIIPNDRIGGDGGGAMKLTIVNNTSARIGNVVEQRISATERALIIQEAVGATAAQMGDPNSGTSRSMNRNFSVQRSR